MTIENQFDRIATALEGIGQRIEALGATIAAMNGGTIPANPTPTPAPVHTPTPAQVERLAEAVQAAAVAVDASAEEAPAPEPKKRGRPALKAVETATEAAPVMAAPAPVMATPAPVKEAPAATEEAPAATEDAVKTAILAHAGKYGKAAALAILERHGAARVRDLDPSTYGAVLADIAKG